MKQEGQRTESLLFAMVLLLHLLPVLLLTPFVTLDGPAHLYNTRMLHTFWFGEPGVIASFFEFNNFPEPNWTGHVLLALFQCLAAPLLAEKLMIILILLLTAWSYRMLIFQIRPEAGWLSWLIFPFLYNFPLLLGFFNFALAMALLPAWIAWWMKHHREVKSLRTTTGIALFFLLLYFSHLVVFLLAGMTAGLVSLLNREKNSELSLQKELGFLLLVSLPGLVMSFLFVFVFGTDGYRGEITRLPLKQLFDDLLNARMFIVYDYNTEKRLSLAFTVILLLLTVLGMRQGMKNKFRNFLIMNMVISLALVFLLPDSLASGGILSVRLVQWFFLSWCLALCCLALPQKVMIAAGLLSALFSLSLMKVHWRVQKELNLSARQYLSSTEKISDNTVLLPLNYSGNWMHSNLVCYLGAVKNIVVLDNYEATQHHFPLVWKAGMDPEIHMGNHVSSNKPCVNIRRSETMTGIKVDYVSVWQKPSPATDSCTQDVLDQLQRLQYRKLLLKEGPLELFSGK
ncbi:MAG: hypothetical protein JNL88_08000 [Bacteroidia bacterium]|nr:hypothetical protein [Bacteroidia bacterium]